LSAAWADISVKAGIDIGGMKGDNLGNMGNGISLAGEYLWSFATGIISIGAGAEYLEPRGNFSCLPIYATGMLKIPITGVYGKVNLGYIPVIDIKGVSGVKGGVYTAGAIGWDILLGLFLEASYGIYNFSADNQADSYYSKVSLSVGYRFAFI
ncbi:MAG: hypothetical protein LBH29_07670, partial [Elusimicrobiota bacterium]|nr:hypothetical protein [Elusimicrobiota bacterium]